MTYDHHIVLGGIAIVLGIISYIPYFRDIFRGKTRPHPFSWLLWGTMDIIALTAQILNNAGAGAWLTALTALQTFVITVIAFKKGEKNIVPIDWICLFGSLAAICIWFATSDALYAVVIVTVTHLIAFIPTIRKSYAKPNEETISTYALSAIKWIPAILAMQSVSLVTVLFPAALIAINGAFVIMLFVRRRQLNV